VAGLDSTAVVLPGTGYLFANDTPGAAPPATTASAIAALNLEAATLATGWNNIGHTSRENNVSLGKDGGDRTTLGTWQAPSLRVAIDPITWSFNFKSVQVSNQTFKWYFGGGSAATADRYDVPDTPTAVDAALWICLVDGSYRLPLYIARASLVGGDALSVDPESFLEMDIVATVVKYTGTPLMSFFNDALGASS
jgi:hypothetical protein